MMKKCFTLLASFLFFIGIMSSVAKADTVVGQNIYTFGEDLTKEQRTALLKEMEYKDGETIITVSNKEEHTYLGGVIPAAQIGTKALSSSKITMKENKTGIIVITKNINWVTPKMYTNALVTAGVKDAEVYVTAPLNVSGTAALTGLMKAYELSSGKEIDDATKKVANEEMVTTAKLGSEIGDEKANNLVTNIKERMAQEEPTTEKEIHGIVTDVAKDLSIQLDQETETKLVALFQKMQEANVDWDNIKEQIDIAKKEWGDSFQEASQGFFDKLMTSIEGFFDKIWDFLGSIITKLKDLFA
ncbi:MAG: DUF1002 domain-containing protein [Bacillaceae bacterium]